MSSTPENKNSNPPETLGWTHGLFGFMSGKKKSNVNSGTESTASKSQKVPRQPSPKPFQNLEGFNTVHSPDQGASKAFTAAGNITGASNAASALPIQLLQQTTPSASASGLGAQTSTAVPSKSPWKASPMGDSKGTRFAVDLRPSSTRAGATRINGRNFINSAASRGVVPVARVRRRNRYKTSGVFQVKRNNRSKKSPIDKVELNAHLMKARRDIEAPRQKIDSDRNVRIAFSNRTCRQGSRLQSSETGRLNGRLPNQQQLVNNGTRFFSNRKREVERDDDQNTIEDVSTRKKRRVNFNGEENNVTTPIESLVSTPGKDMGSRPSKRKATPYKSVMQAEDGIDDDNNGEDKRMVVASKRKLLKARRSPSSKKSDKKSGISNIERLDDFPVMPGTNSINSGDYSRWSTPEVRESSTPVKSCMIINHSLSNFPPKDAAIPSDFMTKRLPQFEQKPLFLGEKKDRTVRDDEAGQDSKRSRGEKWNCKTCGFDNDDDETHCQKYVDKNGKNVRCMEGRSCEVKLGWGNTFAHLTAGKVQCDACKVWNDKERTHCVSCDAPLSSVESNTATTAESPTLGGSDGSKKFSFGGGATAAKISSTGFSFGSEPMLSAPSSTITTGGFQFGTSAPSASSSTTASGGFTFGAPAKVNSPSATTKIATSGATASGGFHFGSPAEPKLSSSTTASTLGDTTKTSDTTSGFKFAAPPKADSLEIATKSASGSINTSSGFEFSASVKPASSTAAPSLSQATVGTTTAPTPLTGTDTGAQLFGNFAASSTPGSSSTQAPKFSFGTNKDKNSTSKQESAKVSMTEPGQKQKSGDTDTKSGFSFPSSTTKDNDAKQSAPAFSFGSSSAAASTTVQATTPGFSFGSSSTTTSSAPSDSATTPTFSFGTNANSSAGTSSAAMPSLGTAATEGNGNINSKKKRRNGDDSNTPSSTQPNVSFCSKPSSEAPVASLLSGGAPALVSKPDGAIAPFVFGSLPANSTKEDNSSINASGFGTSNAPSSFGNASNNSLAASGNTAPTSTPSFGSTPIPVFGSTPAPAPTPGAPSPAPFSFGSTPAPTPAPGASFSFGSPAPAQSAPTFGSTAPAPAAPMTFGSTTAQGPSSGFGSAPVPTNGMTFGTAPHAQSTTFGSTPAAVPAQYGAAAPMAFGSSTPAPAPVPFGVTPGGPPQPFGNNPAPNFNTATTFGTVQPTPGAAPMAFGANAPLQNPAPGGFGGGFGQQATQQQPSAPPNAGFSLGTAPRGRTPGRGRRVIRARRPGAR